MVLHIGGDTILPLDDVIAIIDAESVSSSREMRKYINNCIKNGQITRIGEDECKSYVIATRVPGKNGIRKPEELKNGEPKQSQMVYTSPISSVTLLKRSNYIGYIGNLEESRQR